MADRVAVTISDGVADVRLARADKMNALDPAMFEALRAALDQLGKAHDLRAVVLSGEGRAFCAGLDMASFAAMKDTAIGDLETRTHGMSNDFQYVVLGWRELAVPVIAAVHGVAFGGGFQLMLGADLRFVAADTRLSIMEVKWGLVPDMAGTILMRHLARDDVIRELSYSGRIFSGEEARAFGFATRGVRGPARGSTGVRARGCGQKSRCDQGRQAAVQSRGRRRRGLLPARGIARAGAPHRLAQSERGRSGQSGETPAAVSGSGRVSRRAQCADGLRLAAISAISNRSAATTSCGNDREPRAERGRRGANLTGGM